MHNDPTLIWRIAGGVLILAWLAVRSIRREGWRARRLREYAFLAGITLAAVAYGVGHDALCYTISPEYYIIGKGLHGARDGFYPDVFFLALKTTWTVGLVVAAALLVANNPDKVGRSLPVLHLVPYVLSVLVVCVLLEAGAGFYGYFQAETVAAWLGAEVALHEMGAPFMAVWAMHWGAYGGVALGLVVACIGVVRAKRRNSDGLRPTAA